MTENLEKENPSTPTNPQTDTPELLEALKGTFDRLNSTIEQIQADRENHDRIKQKKINALRLLAAPAILLVVALSAYMFYMASLMEQAISNMSNDMSNMRNNMQTMTSSMGKITDSIGKITDNVQILAVNVTNMNKVMIQMSRNMQVVSVDLHKMSENMIVMSEDMGKVRKATVYMEYSIRSLTQKVDKMSNAVSPVMEGARTFMPWGPYQNRRR
jgi:methyl-accepting chemotaxis protein